MIACGAEHPSGGACHLPPHDDGWHRSDLPGGQRVRWQLVDDNPSAQRPPNADHWYTVRVTSHLPTLP